MQINASRKGCNMNSGKIFFAMGLVFSPLAAIMAFIITYEEYARHYDNKKKPFQLAFSTAIVAFSTFMIISIVMGYLFSHILVNSI